jgi:hypothetical protein
LALRFVITFCTLFSSEEFDGKNNKRQEFRQHPGNHKRVFTPDYKLWPPT